MQGLYHPLRDPSIIEKAESANSLPFCTVTDAFSCGVPEWVVIYKGCIFSWGANKRMQFSGSMQSCGNRLAIIYFRPRVSFLLISVQY